MADQARSEIIQDNPIGKGLDTFRSSFNLVCENQTIPSTPDSLRKLDYDGLLLSKTGRNTIRNDLLRLIFAVASDVFDFDRIKPLLIIALADNPDDVLIWDQVYNAITESTPPPQPIASSLQQTPWLRNTSSFANFSEHRKYVDGVLKEELGPMYVGLRNFHEAFFGGVAGLETASKAVFKKCMEGNNPHFRADEGWRGWPEDANQDRVLAWFADLSENLAAFAKDYKSTPTCQRRPLAKPN